MTQMVIDQQNLMLVIEVCPVESGSEVVYSREMPKPERFGRTATGPRVDTRAHRSA